MALMHDVKSAFRVHTTSAMAQQSPLIVVVKKNYRTDCLGRTVGVPLPLGKPPAKFSHPTFCENLYE